MSRLWHGGGEFHAKEMLPTTTNSGPSISTAQHTGVGSARSFGFGQNIANAGYIYATIPGTVSQSPSSGADIIYYKSDIYIDSLPNNVAYKFQPLAFNIVGTLYVLAIDIYKSGGTLYLKLSKSTGDITTPVALGVSEDAWFRLEASLNITALNSNPGRNATVKVNGTEIINEDLPGLSSGASDMGVRMMNNTGSDDTTALVYMDNIVVNNQYGSYNNSWIGEEVVVYLPPAGAGDSNATAGTYASINEKPSGGGVGSDPAFSIILSDATTEAWYTVTDPTTIFNYYDSVKALHIPLIMREATSSVTEYQLGIKSESSGTTVTTASFDAGNTTNRINPNGITELGNILLSETDPTTSLPWKVTGVNSIINSQIGVLNKSANDIWVGSMGMMLGYVPGTPPPATDGMLIMFW